MPSVCNLVIIYYVYQPTCSSGKIYSIYLPIYNSNIIIIVRTGTLLPAYHKDFTRYETIP